MLHREDSKLCAILLTLFRFAGRLRRNLGDVFCCSLHLRILRRMEAGCGESYKAVLWMYNMYKFSKTFENFWEAEMPILLFVKCEITSLFPVKSNKYSPPPRLLRILDSVCKLNQQTRATICTTVYF